MLGQEPQRQLPDNPPLDIGEAVKLVHHHGADLVEVELVAVQQPVGEDLGHHDQDSRVGILAAIAGDQADVGCLESPLDGQLPHLAKLLLVRAISGVV